MRLLQSSERSALGEVGRESAVHRYRRVYVSSAGRLDRRAGPLGSPTTLCVTSDATAHSRRPTHDTPPLPANCGSPRPTKIDKSVFPPTPAKGAAWCQHSVARNPISRGVFQRRFDVLEKANHNMEQVLNTADFTASSNWPVQPPSELLNGNVAPS